MNATIQEKSARATQPNRAKPPKATYRVVLVIESDKKITDAVEGQMVEVKLKD